MVKIFTQFKELIKFLEANGMHYNMHINRIGSYRSFSLFLNKEPVFEHVDESSIIVYFKFIQSLKDNNRSIEDIKSIVNRARF